MPDLGRYALEVSLAYAASLALLAGLVALSLRRSDRVRRRLEEIERRMTRR